MYQSLLLLFFKQNFDELVDHFDLLTRTLDVNLSSITVEQHFEVFKGYRVGTYQLDDVFFVNNAFMLSVG